MAAAGNARHRPFSANRALPCPFACLPRPVTELILAALVQEDARDACAAACVCFAWAAAARTPAVWRKIRLAESGRGVRRACALTDGLLAKVLCRARGCVEELEISGCYALTDAGLQLLMQQRGLRCVALTRGVAQQPPLAQYRPDGVAAACADAVSYAGDERAAREGTQLTPWGVAAALRHAAPLQRLAVDGFCGQEDGPYATYHLETLLPLVGGDAARLDVCVCLSDGYQVLQGRFCAEEAACGADADQLWLAEPPEGAAVAQSSCGRLLRRADARLALQCARCRYTVCAHCPEARNISRCGGCGQFECSACAEDSDCAGCVRPAALLGRRESASPDGAALAPIT